MCNCGKKSQIQTTTGGLAAFALSAYGDGYMAEEFFRSAPINLKQSVLDAGNGKKTYFIRASDARKYNEGNRYLVIRDVRQKVAEPIIVWLRNNPFHKHDFADAVEVVEVEAAPTPALETETVEPVEPVEIEVNLEADTLYIAAYEANVLYEHLDPDDFGEMTLEELQHYVDHYQIDVGRATAESTIRERVIDWYNDANNG